MMKKSNASPRPPTDLERRIARGVIIGIKLALAAASAWSAIRVWADLETGSPPGVPGTLARAYLGLVAIVALGWAGLRLWLWIDWATDLQPDPDEGEDEVDPRDDWGYSRESRAGENGGSTTP